MNRRRVMHQWLVFGGLFVGFMMFLWILFHTEPTGPTDF